MRKLTAIVCLCMLVSSKAHSQGRGFSSTIGGGRGLLSMQSARTYGQGNLVLGMRGLAMEKESRVLMSPGNYDLKNDFPVVYALPLTYGLTNEIDLTAGLFAFRDSRSLNDIRVLSLGFGPRENGMGASYLGVKIRLPLSPQSRVQIAGKFGAFMETSKKELEGMNYFWTRRGTSVESSIYETFDFTSFLSLHFEQGYAISRSRYYDDQVVGGAGLQLNLRDRLVINLEVNNRTFLGVSPQSAFRADKQPSRFISASTNAPGSPSFLSDSRADFNEDYFVFTPSVALRLNKHISVDFGAHINIADQVAPRERFQVIAGMTLKADIRSMMDTDHDGIPNSRDAEPRTTKGFPVDKRGVAIDTDGDGVPDGRDHQSDTPRGARVDADGVGIDSDGDGVYDGLDQEPQTPSGAPVDRFGVALDDDRDGIPNDRDLEPDSPAGAVVDRNGTALDSDGDGVPNGIDSEAETPAGAKVNSRGASLDEDGDGVPDGLDEEANTPKGVLVDRKGRALIKQESSLLNQGFIRLNSLRFEAASVMPDPESYPLIDEIGRLLLRYPTLNLQIEGHTDDEGSKESNYQLSRERARIILEYLLRRFPELRRERFRVVGFGPDKPIASNAMPEGRKENRRVDFVVINRGELLKIKTNNK